MFLRPEQEELVFTAEWIYYVFQVSWQTLQLTGTVKAILLS
jgi:hypothetical protein